MPLQSSYKTIFINTIATHTKIIVAACLALISSRWTLNNLGLVGDGRQHGGRVGHHGVGSGLRSAVSARGRDLSLPSSGTIHHALYYESEIPKRNQSRRYQF